MAKSGVSRITLKVSKLGQDCLLRGRAHDSEQRFAFDEIEQGGNGLALTGLGFVHQDEMTAAIAPDPQQRAFVPGVLCQSGCFFSVSDLMAVD